VYRNVSPVITTLAILAAVAVVIYVFVRLTNLKPVTILPGVGPIDASGRPMFAGRGGGREPARGLRDPGSRPAFGSRRNSAGGAPQGGR
jgi:hypothetical protein